MQKCNITRWIIKWDYTYAVKILLDFVYTHTTGNRMDFVKLINKLEIEMFSKYLKLL